MKASDTWDSEDDLKGTPKRLRGIYKWVRGFFYASAAGLVIMMIGCVFVFFTDYTGYNPDRDFMPPDIFKAIGSLIYLVAFIGGIIAFSMFTYRAMKNLHIWKNKYAEMLPGWTVGWYFIPFANLWKPYHAMEQIWTGTYHAISGKYEANGKVGLWWACWIFFYFTSGIGNAMSRWEGPWNIVLRRSAMVDLFSLSLGVLAILIIVPVLKIIMERQDGKIESHVFS